MPVITTSQQPYGPVGNAQAADVLAGKTFSATGSVDIVGTMPNNGALNYNPSTAAQAIPAGNTSGGTVAAVGGTAAVGNVLVGDTFSSGNGIGLTGTMPNNGAPTLQPGTAISAGYYSGGSAAPVKTAVGTASNSSTSEAFYRLGGTALSQYLLSIPVPAGLTNIIAVWCYTQGALYLDNIQATPLGYADGVDAGCLVVQNSNVNDEILFQTGGALSLSSAGITLPYWTSTTETVNYLIIYT